MKATHLSTSTLARATALGLTLALLGGCTIGTDVAAQTPSPDGASATRETMPEPSAEEVTEVEGIPDGRFVTRDGYDQEDDDPLALTALVLELEGDRFTRSMITGDGVDTPFAEGTLEYDERGRLTLVMPAHEIDGLHYEETWTTFAWTLDGSHLDLTIVDKNWGGPGRELFEGGYLLEE